MFYFKKNSLSKKIFFVLAVVIFIFTLAIGFFSTVFIQKVITSHFDQNLINTAESVKKIVETSANLSVRSYLRAIAEQNRNQIEDLYLRSQSGELFEEEAKDIAKKLLLAQKIGESGYIYTIDSSGLIISHPFSNLIGNDVSAYDFVRKQIQDKHGFILYEWQNSEDEKPRNKILYMEYFEEWDWIISVSAYRGELISLLDATDFREKILSIKIGEFGYPFILSTTGEMVVHPQLSGDVINNNQIYSDFMKEIIDDRQGKQYYTWPDPSGVKKDEEKVAVYLFVEDFNWIVAATGYVTDFYSSVKILNIIYIALMIISLFCSIFVAFFLSKSITKPLTELLEKIGKDAKNISGEKVDNQNEIESIASYFSHYLNLLTKTNRQLKTVLEEKKQNIEELNIFKKVFETTRDGVTITDTEGTIKTANQSFYRITGYSQDEAVGMNPRILKSGKHPDSFYTSMWDEIKTVGFWRGEIWNKRKNGEIYPEWLTISAVKNEAGETIHYAAIFNDISLFIKQKDEIEFLAFHDSLTKLPNRLNVIDKLDQAVASSQRHGGEVVCMVIDLDNFSTVNESLGHAAGDDLLKRFASRLSSVVRAEDSFGRAGGDQFVYVFNNKDNKISYLPVFERLMNCVKEPFSLFEIKHYLTISIGISTSPADGATAAELLKRADLALSKAKQDTGNSYAFFDYEMEVDIKQKIKYLSQIRSGITREEFIPFYQPKIEIQSGKMIGVEALARWKSGNSIISPGTFIPLSEESGLIFPLSELLFKEVLQDAKKILELRDDLHFAFNLSPLQFNKESSIDKLVAMTETEGISPQHIEFEVTESALMNDPKKSQRILNKLVDIGFSIGIDDFGTGYSSLQYLKQFPLSTLKIDMSFISGIGRDENDEILIQTIIEMASQFNLEITAEGIEEKIQEQFLSALNCHYGQGYYYSKPMGFKSLESALKNSSVQ